MGKVLFSALFQAAQPHRHAPVAGLYAPEEIPEDIELTGQLRRVFALWMSKRHGRPMPLRSDIDPIDLHAALPFVILWDVTRPGPGFTCRVAGTEICHRAGRELRGQSLEAMAGDDGDAILEEYRSVVASGHIHIIERRISWFGRPLRAYRRMVLPLTGRSGAIDFVLTCVDFGEEGTPATRLN